MTLAKVLDLLNGDLGKELVEKIQGNTRLFRERMVDAGFTVKVTSASYYIIMT